MPFFYVWETVDFPIHLTRSDDNEGILENCKDVIISFEQTGILLEKNKDSVDVALDIENDIINVHLSQEETGQFKADKSVNIQVNILYEDSERDTSAIATIMAYKNLHKEVMS